MTDIETAQEILEAAARMDRLPTAEEVACSQAYASLSIAKSLDYLCGHWNAPGSLLLELNNIAQVVTLQGQR